MIFTGDVKIPAAMEIKEQEDSQLGLKEVREFYVEFEKRIIDRLKKLLLKD